MSLRLRALDVTLCLLTGVVLCFLTGAISPVAAQTITSMTGAINGVVSDSTKAVVLGVMVKLSGPSLVTALNISLVDVRTEKTFRVNDVRVMGFFDVYNMLNTNAAQTFITSSGSFWLRPTAITGPRVLRIGARLEW